jgi:hypothetical protein
MGNGEWGMGNGEWGMGNGEWGMGNGEWGMGNGKNSSLRARAYLFFFASSLFSLRPLRRRS